MQRVARAISPSRTLQLVTAVLMATWALGWFTNSVQRCDTQAVPELPRGPGGHLFLPLATTNDIDGQPDPTLRGHLHRAADWFATCQRQGLRCRMLTSGGIDKTTGSARRHDGSFNFNPTATPQHEWARRYLATARSIPSGAFLPGVPAMHTVDEALMTRELLIGIGACATTHVVVTTSSFHQARAAHLFGVALSSRGGCAVPSLVVEALHPLPTHYTPALLDRRRTHESAALRSLQTNPFGAWKSFLEQQGIPASFSPMVAAC